MEIRQLTVGSRIEAPLFIREARVRTRRAGGELITFVLADRSGSVAAVALEPDEAIRAAAQAGTVAHVSGVLTADERFGDRVVVEALRTAAEGEYDAESLRDGPDRPVALLEQDLRELIATVQNPWLHQLLDAVLGPETQTWARFVQAPAAKRYHQAYRGGLLEHSVTVAQAVSAISATFGGVDRDVAVTGAILHDIGKLDAYTQTGEGIEMSDDGRLFGEIPLGYYRVRQELEAIDGFPPSLSQALLHIILSHHGSLEHGSPVVPATREAALVHGIDNLGARLGSFDRVEKSLTGGQRWSGYDKALGGGAYFAPIVERAA